jgi:hypothetical protein
MAAGSVPPGGRTWTPSRQGAGQPDPRFPQGGGEQAIKRRAVARRGKDTIKERERVRREAAKADHTHETVALEAFAARKAELKGDGKAGRWFATP